MTEMAGDWSGQARTLNVDTQDGIAAGADHVAILLQNDYRHGPIVGAAWAQIAPRKKVMMGR